MTLATYVEAFRKVRVNVLAAGHISPHKICMLLAVLDLARGGALSSNRIAFDPQLLDRYRVIFEAVRRPGDHPNPYFPFFHLAGKLKTGAQSFWHLRALPGRELVVESLVTVTKVADITSNIDYAFLNDDLFELLQDGENIAALSESLTEHWFERDANDLLAVVGLCAKISQYESSLRSGSQQFVSEAPPPLFVRDPAFRRVVTGIYDYRCAATGLRLVLPSGEALVQAAHIHPFSEAGDDDPRNGVALTPDIHWAMDKNLIAPGLDLKWHVSSAIDDRIPDFQILCGLEGRPMILPNERRYSPKRAALEWRMQMLRRGPD